MSTAETAREVLDAVRDEHPDMNYHGRIGPARDLARAVLRVEALADRLDWEADPANHSGNEEDWGRVAAAIRIRTALNGDDHE